VKAVGPTTIVVNYEVIRSVSISSPSGEGGGGVKYCISKMVEGTRIKFPLVLLQVKAVGARPILGIWGTTPHMVSISSPSGEGGGTMLNKFFSVVSAAFCFH